MRINHIFAFLGFTILISSCHSIEKDKHLEIPFFHEILNNKNMFLKFFKTDKEPIFINDKMFLIISSSELPNEENNINLDEKNQDLKQEQGKILFKYELRDFENNIILNEKIIVDNYYNTPNVFIDNNSNLYINDNKYLAPTYSQKQKIELIIIQDKLNDYTSTIKNPTNISLNYDSLRNKQFLVLQKKYNFKADKDKDYVFLQRDRLITSSNRTVNQFKLKFKYFDEFDDPITVQYKPHGRLSEARYEYHYYQYKKFKFKYSEPESGLGVPILLKNGEQTIMFHQKYGFFKLLW